MFIKLLRAAIVAGASIAIMLSDSDHGPIEIESDHGHDPGYNDSEDWWWLTEPTIESRASSNQLMAAVAVGVIVIAVLHKHLIFFSYTTLIIINEWLNL